MSEGNRRRLAHRACSDYSPLQMLRVADNTTTTTTRDGGSVVVRTQ
ncbi:MAG: hypothetical protein HY898_15805 [Deltaproteobacteria bacterium]|nr:hypothetical protein [Deltaproteobacteria bacterium]